MMRTSKTLSTPQHTLRSSAARKIKPFFPKNAEPLFCTPDNRICTYINKAGGYCFLLSSSNIDKYDFSFCNQKEIWIFHQDETPDQLNWRFGYALLRHGATKVQMQAFPILGELFNE